MIRNNHIQLRFICDFVKTYGFLKFLQYLEKKPSIGLKPAVDKDNTNNSSIHHSLYLSTFPAYKAIIVKLKMYEGLSWS